MSFQRVSPVGIAARAAVAGEPELKAKKRAGDRSLALFVEYRIGTDGQGIVQQ